MIADKLMAFMAEKNRKSSDKRLGNMSMSDVPYCRRKTAYKLHNYAPTNRPQPGAMEVGTVFHAVLQEWAREVFGDKFHSEEAELILPVDYHDPRTDRMERAFIKGHCDGIIETEEGPVIIDFKTYRGVAWKYRTPLKQNYIDQVQLYIRAAEHTPKVPSCVGGLIVHACKDDLGMDEDCVSTNRKRADKLVGKMSDILGTQTPEEFNGTPELKWECNYCSYKSECKGEK